MENISRNQEGIEKGRQGKKEWKKPCLIILNIQNTKQVSGDGVDGEGIGS